MKNYKYFSIMSVAVLAALATESSFAALKATKFPATFKDVPFTQRVQTKAEGYEPYKDMRAYVIPEFIDDVKKQKKGKKDPNEECPDPNMDEDCECTGLGMDPKSAASGTCKCLSSKASVKNGDCVCNDDPSLDPTKDCAQKLPPEPNKCSDAPHMDANCNCLPVNGNTTKPDSDGWCACTDGSGNIDPNLDINNDCKPIVADTYKLVQCRAKSRTMRKFLNGDYNGAVSKFMPYNDVLGSTLNCGVKNRDAYDACFTPCQKPGAPSDPGVINTDLTGIIDNFCAANWGSAQSVWFFSEVNDPTSDKLYNKDEVDKVIAKLMTNYSSGFHGECSVGLSTWYVIAFSVDANNKIKYYKHVEIYSK